MNIYLWHAGSAVGQGEGVQLSGRERDYTEVVKALNEANLSRQKYDAVSAFASAAAKDATGIDGCTCNHVAWKRRMHALRSVKRQNL